MGGTIGVSPLKPRLGANPQTPKDGGKERDRKITLGLHYWVQYIMNCRPDTVSPYFSGQSSIHLIKILIDLLQKVAGERGYDRGFTPKTPTGRLSSSLHELRQTPKVGKKI